MRRPAPLLIALLLAAAGCGTGPSEVNPQDGLRGAIAQNSNLSRFSAAIGNGPLAAQLTAGNVTVFAPTNIAYRFLGAEALRRLEASPDVYLSVLRRHIVPGIVDPAALTDGAELPTLEGTPLLVRHIGGRVTVGGQPVDLDPFDAGNGLLYEVDGFYSDHLDARTRLGLISLADRFRDALARAGELNRLEGPGPVTVFAPINDAFLRLGASELDLLFSPTNADILDRVARLHIAPGEIRLDGPDASVIVTTFDDFPLTLQSVGGAVTLNGVPVYTLPIETANGIIYLIGGVILDGLTLEQRIRSSSSLRTFLEWASVHPDLMGVLMGTEPHTVFAPTSSSIAGIPENVRTAIRRPENAVLFERIMQMHFVTGRLTSAELPDGASVPTLEGSTLEVTNTPDAFRVEGRDILRRDLPARNGILHIVDGLLTPDVDAFDGAILRGAPSFADVIRHAGLEWLVRGPGPISVIAFSDDAIASTPDLLTRPDLPSIIRYHIANGDIGLIHVGMTFVPLEGPVRTVTEFGPSGFMLDGAPFFSDLHQVTNGHLYSVGAIQAPPDPRSPRRTVVMQ